LAHTVVTPPEKLAEVDRGCRSAGIGCGDCKKMLAESLEVELVPIRQRAGELRAEPARVEQILGDGAATCRNLAKETMRMVKDAAQVKGFQSRP
jgi:tryptophanyl-tRNA synthetase